MQRRSFLAAILAASAAPAIVSAKSLMPLRVVKPKSFWVFEGELDLTLADKLNALGISKDFLYSPSLSEMNSLSETSLRAHYQRIKEHRELYQDCLNPEFGKVFKGAIINEWDALALKQRQRRQAYGF